MIKSALRVLATRGYKNKLMCSFHYRYKCFKIFTKSLIPEAPENPRSNFHNGTKM